MLLLISTVCGRCGSIDVGEGVAGLSMYYRRRMQCGGVHFCCRHDNVSVPLPHQRNEMGDGLKSLQRWVYSTTRSRLLGKTQPTGDKAEDEGAVILEVRQGLLPSRCEVWFCTIYEFITNTRTAPFATTSPTSGERHSMKPAGLFFLHPAYAGCRPGQPQASPCAGLCGCVKCIMVYSHTTFRPKNIFTVCLCFYSQ